MPRACPPGPGCSQLSATLHVVPRVPWSIPAETGIINPGLTPMPPRSSQSSHHLAPDPRTEKLLCNSSAGETEIIRPLITWLKGTELESFSDKASARPQGCPGETPAWCTEGKPGSYPQSAADGAEPWDQGPPQPGGCAPGGEEQPDLQPGPGWGWGSHPYPSWRLGASCIQLWV